jgi:hypothetical protein
LLYLVPNPELDHLYAIIYGDASWAIAIADPEGLNAIPYVADGKIDGSAYLTPKPELNHGYTVTKGAIS